jgi:hypothetical protein
MMKDILTTRKIIEELDKKIFNSERILNKNSLEVYRVKHGEDCILFVFSKNKNEKTFMEGEFFIYSSREKIAELIGEEYKEEKEPYVIKITVYTPNPTKKLMDLIRENKSLRLEYYVASSHEIAHYLLLKSLNEEEGQKNRKKIRKINKYEKNLYLYDIKRQKEKSLNWIDFYLRNLLPFFTYFEMYAHSVSILTILDMLKENKISVQEAKEFFEKLLFFFFHNAEKFIKEYIKNGKLEVKDVKDLEKLDHLFASYIISSILFKRLNENEIVELYEEFENNIDVIKKLFGEIKEWSKSKIFEEAEKLQQIAVMYDFSV